MGRDGFFNLLMASVVAQLSSATATGDADVIADFTKLIANPPPSWIHGDNVCNGVGITCDSSGRIRRINLTNMGLSGTLTPLLSSLSVLESLEIKGNKLSGALPSLSGLNHLTSLALSHNSFTNIPFDFFLGLNSLTNIEMDHLPLEPWSIHDSIATCTALQKLSVRNASVTGSFPAAIANLTSVSTLLLSDNYLTGDLPAWLAGFGALKFLSLGKQKGDPKLSGPLDVLSSLKNLQQLWIQSNEFTGPIPDFSSQLRSLDVRDNLLTGVVPASLMGMETLNFVGLSNNLLQGPFPEFQAGVSVDIMSGNKFCIHDSGPCDPEVTFMLEVASGFEYPVEIARSWAGNNPCNGGWVGIVCKNTVIVEINLSDRNLSGIISPAFGNLTLMEKIDLSNNQLEGVIPDVLVNLTHLKYFSVSNNKLTGLVPRFNPSVQVITAGGKDSNLPGSQHSTVRKIALIVGIVAGAAVILLIFWLSLHLLRKKRKASMLPTHMENGRKTSILSEYYVDKLPMDVLLNATDNFSQDNKLGAGGFGVVFKGHLSGKPVAVKRCNTAAIDTEKLQEFDAEIDVLGRLKHCNLVQLLGYCVEGNERILVYEFMSAGSLREHLKPKGHTPLTWMQRVKIALDVARGIQYLHSMAHESFIHRDLKPANILLDRDLRAKVSDFGLVRPAMDTDMVKIAGTYGYLAPEYATAGNLTTKVDVYAYGVILMELITGRVVLDDTLAEEDKYLVPIFQRNVVDKNGLKKIVDPALELKAEYWKVLSELAILACHCTAPQPDQRPVMHHCVNVISSVVDSWKPVVVDDNEGETSTMGLKECLEIWQKEDLMLGGSMETSSSFDGDLVRTR